MGIFKVNGYYPIEVQHPFRCIIFLKNYSCVYPTQLFKMSILALLQVFHTISTGKIPRLPFSVYTTNYSYRLQYILYGTNFKTVKMNLRFWEFVPDKRNNHKVQRNGQHPSKGCYPLWFMKNYRAWWKNKVPAENQVSCRNHSSRGKNFCA